MEFMTYLVYNFQVHFFKLQKNECILDNNSVIELLNQMPGHP